MQPPEHNKPLVYRGVNHAFRVEEENILIWNADTIREECQQVLKLHEPIFKLSKLREGEDAMGVVLSNRIILRILLDDSMVFERAEAERQELLPDGLEGGPGCLEVHFEPQDAARRVLTQFNKLRICTLTGFKFQGMTEQLLSRKYF